LLTNGCVRVRAFIFFLFTAQLKRTAWHGSLLPADVRTAGVPCFWNSIDQSLPNSSVCSGQHPTSSVITDTLKLPTSHRRAITRFSSLSSSPAFWSGARAICDNLSWLQSRLCSRVHSLPIVTRQLVAHSRSTAPLRKATASK